MPNRSVDGKLLPRQSLAMHPQKGDGGENRPMLKAFRSRI